MTEKSVRTLLGENHQPAFEWSRQCCRFNDDLAREVLQTVYLKILEGKAVWHKKSTFRTWLFSVIRYSAIDALRSANNFLSLDRVGEMPEAEAGNMTDYRRIIRKLPARQSEVLLLAFYHDMTLEQVAGVTGLSIGTVRTHYDRGKQALRKILKKENIYHE